MANVKFYLDNRSDGNGKPVITNLPIYLFYSFNGKRLKYFTGERVDLKNWDDNGFTKKTAPRADTINRNLKSIKLFVEKTHSDLIALHINPTVELFKGKLNNVFKGKIDGPKEVFVKSALDMYLSYIHAKFTFNTYRNTKTFVNHITECFGENKLSKLPFSKIDQAFIEVFKTYLVNKGRLNNTIAKNLDKFRGFLTWSAEKKYFTNSDIKIASKANDIEVIFLNYEELKHVQSFKLDTASLEHVRDVFVFACYTGQRYSDIFKLKKLDIKEDKIQFYITKGRKTVSQSVPLVAESRRILKKYNDIPGDKALPVISNQKMNLYIKDLMKEAKFNEIITIAEKQGDGSIVEKQFSKWQLISCHTSRKTFITVAMTLGMPEAVIKSITGHSKDSKAFTKYYSVVDSLKDSEMNKIFK